MKLDQQNQLESNSITSASKASGYDANAPLSSSGQHAFPPDPRFYFPHFQPIVDIPSGRIAGYESLTRTHHKDGKIASAGLLYDENSLSSDMRLNIDRSVRKKALERFADDPNSGLLFINISARWASILCDDSTSPTVKMIREIGIDPSRVVIEITEKYCDVKALASLVAEYRSEGMKVAIDDFGVGGSQIDRLIALKPDYLKIDMGIFKDAARKGESAKVLLALSSISEQAQFEIICEGIENEEEFHFAIECGAQKVQGWLFGEANEALLEPNATRASIASLQNLYLERKKEAITRSSQRTLLIEKYVDVIFDYYQRNSAKSIDVKEFFSEGFLRYYLCDLSGKQISPTYNFSERGIREDNSHVGCYWSHRPYFPKAMNVINKVSQQKYISRNYIDGFTKQLCKTAAVLIDEERLLFVDALAFDEILYCEQD